MRKKKTKLKVGDLVCLSMFSLCFENIGIITRVLNGEKYEVFSYDNKKKWYLGDGLVELVEERRKRMG